MVWRLPGMDGTDAVVQDGPCYGQDRRCRKDPALRAYSKTALGVASPKAFFLSFAEFMQCSNFFSKRQPYRGKGIRILRRQNGN